ncbi:cell division protein FtsQ [Streptomyces zagrosensis]|uniref:Cell division protein FtsQ n=1 Tax=Streptomyces zagrosensis TaxID=1042984 RepID=A0A7W9Q4I4_9ACTN|nr:cell division protein FtsQ [Streptomyces zagrosensis]
MLAAIVAVLLGGVSLWVLYGSDWLRVERVTVQGAEALRPEEVREAAAVPMDAPLMSVDTGTVAKRLRAKLPRIASVHVERSWPNTIGLKVTERQPELLLEKAGKFIEMDAEGVRFATVAKAPKGIPRLEMEAKRSPSLRRFGEEYLRRAAVEVASSLPATVRADTRVIRVRSYDAISLELSDGRTVQWGSPEQDKAKSVALVALLKAEREAEHFDVSAPGAPAVSGS